MHAQRPAHACPVMIASSSSPGAAPLIRHPLPLLGAATARVLILGSMPGAASLAARAYYAHPRNQFWSIMAALTGVPPGAPYAERTAALCAVGVAVWDVVAACRRRGSLDAAIEDGSVRHQDVAGAVRAMPQLRLIAFNGREAERQFQRAGHTDAPEWPTNLAFAVLPSTSPAMASLAPAQKQRCWLDQLRPFLGSHEKLTGP